jgi:hypothetical protein
MISLAQVAIMFVRHLRHYSILVIVVLRAGRLIITVMNEFYLKNAFIMARTRPNKPLIETDKPGGRPIKYWRTAKSAADYYKLGNQVIISYNVKGITKQAKGHYFRYATEREIKDYEEILRREASETNANKVPVGPEPIINIPAETIPEVVNKPEPNGETLSPFERLLQESKKKFKNNSD